MITKDEAQKRCELWRKNGGNGRRDEIIETVMGKKFMKTTLFYDYWGTELGELGIGRVVKQAEGDTFYWPCEE